MNPELCRAESFLVALADGRRFQVAPPTRGAFRAALALDPDEANQSPGDSSARRSRQLAELLGSHLILPDGAVTLSAPILAELSPTEESELLAAIAAQGVRGDSGTRKTSSIPKRPPLAERLNLFDRDTLALALHLQRTATEVEAAVGFIESLRLLETVYAREKERVRFEAAIHGIRI